jgi:class 3 adenylate cyclase
MVVRCHTFLFADLVGFTAFTEEHGDDAAADLAETFATAAVRLALEHGVRLVKCLGDAVMLRADDAGEAVQLGVRMHSELDGLAPIHAGAHTGRAVERGGDWYGAAVNLAARVACVAAEGELLVTESTVASAGPLTGIELEHRGERAFKNVGGATPLYVARGAELPAALAA